jgi:hypothetical protein
MKQKYTYDQEEEMKQEFSPFPYRPDSKMSKRLYEEGDGSPDEEMFIPEEEMSGIQDNEGKLDESQAETYKLIQNLEENEFKSSMTTNLRNIMRRQEKTYLTSSSRFVSFNFNYLDCFIHLCFRECKTNSLEALVIN